MSGKLDTTVVPSWCPPLRLPTRPACVLSALIVILVVGAAKPARAEPTPAERAQAVQLYRQALALSRQGDLTAAIELFERAERQGQLRNALWNLAECQRQLGRLTAARASLLRFRDHPRSPESDRQLASRELATLEARVPRLEVVVAPAGARVVVDGQEVGASPMAVWLDPGPHVVEAASPAFSPARKSVTLIEGARQRVELQLSLAPARLRVSSLPAGAEIWLAGRRLGRAPLEETVPAGTFELQGRQAGRRTVRRTVTVTPGERTVAELVLPERVSVLAVDVTRPGARVVIGGQLAGVTPLPPQRVPPGATEVRVEQAGHDAWRERLQLGDGQTTAVTVQLRRGRLHPAWFAAAAAVGAGLLAGAGALLADSQAAAAHHAALTALLEQGAVPLGRIVRFKASLRETATRTDRRFDQATGLFVAGGVAASAAVGLAIFTRWRRSEARVVITGPGAQLEGRF
jgi:hypothetical protein